MDNIPALPYGPTIHRRRQLSPPPYPMRKSKTHHVCVIGNGIVGVRHSSHDLGREMASRSPDSGDGLARASDQILLHDNRGYAWRRNSKFTLAPVHGKRVMRGNTRIVLAGHGSQTIC
jgi:hypothetical protein